MSARIRKSMEQRDGGFTLVELLVVMIIIGILAAIAIPVFLNQQKKARDTAAKADVSTIAKEIAAYYVDGALVLTAAGSAGKWTLVDSASGAVADGKLSTGNSVTTKSKVTSISSFCVAISTSDGNTWKYDQTGSGTGDCP